MKCLYLKKYDVYDIRPEISEAIIKKLEETLADVENLSKDEVEVIVKFQDKDGGFRPFVGHWIYDNDAYIRVANYTSFLCLCILINADLCKIANVDRHVFDLAFSFIEKNSLKGHGYDAEVDEINNLILFLSNGLKEFFKKHSPYYLSAETYFSSIIGMYRNMLSSNKTIVGFAVDIKDDIEKMLGLYDYTYYIAYGSNINKQQMMNVRCKGANPVDVILLKNYRLDFQLYLTINHDDNYSTPVVVWKINEDNEASLDRSEGVAMNIYRKEYIRLCIENVYRYCLVYIMNDIPERRNALPFESYMKKCMGGYDDFNLDKCYLIDALERTKNK